jgi:hypothetical protein
MKRKRTEKSKYKHISTGDYCTCAAYVAEILCIRKSEIENKGTLPFKFWNKKPWDWTFKRQLIAAREILKTYSESALVRAIHSDEFKRIFSLNNPKALPIIKKYAAIVEKENSKQQELKIEEKPENRKKTYGKKSSFDKLRSIEGNGKKSG